MPFGIEQVPVSPARQPQGGLLSGLEEGLDRIKKENEMRKQMQMKEEMDVRSGEREQKYSLARQAAAQAGRIELKQMAERKRQQKYEGMGRILRESPSDAVQMPQKTNIGTFRLGAEGETQRLQNYVAEFAKRASASPRTRMDLMNEAGSEDEYRRLYPRDWSSLITSEEGQAVLDRLPKKSYEPRSVQAWALRAEDPDSTPEQRHRARQMVDNYRTDALEAGILSEKSRIGAGVKPAPMTTDERQQRLDLAQRKADLEASKTQLKLYTDSVKSYITSADKELSDVKGEYTAFLTAQKDAKKALREMSLADPLTGKSKGHPKFNVSPYEDILKEDPTGKYEDASGLRYSYTGGVWESADDKKERAELERAWGVHQAEVEKWNSLKGGYQETLDNAAQKAAEIFQKQAEVKAKKDRLLRLLGEARRTPVEELPGLEEFGETPAADPLGIR